MSTTEKAISKIIKVGQAEHIAALLNHGELYLKTVDWFRQADANSERFDQLEGAISIDQVVYIKLRAEDGHEFELSRADYPKHTAKHGRLLSAYVFTHEDGVMGNIFSCTGVGVGEGQNFKRLDKRFGRFGDAAILIENPNVFLDRVESALRQQGFKYTLGLVDYFDPETFVGNLNVFKKKKVHSYQQEIRIWVERNSKEDLKLRIGSLRDIAVVFKLNGILENA